jgi:hypothetical protein
VALTTNLISYWPLNEASGTRSDVHGTNHLTAGSGNESDPTSAAGLVYANAAVFDENSYSSLFIADNADLSTGDISFTLSAWVKFTNDVPYNYVVACKAASDFSLDEYKIWKNSANDFVFQVCTEGGSYAQADDTPPGGFAVDTWYLITGGHDATSDEVWIRINAETRVTTAHSGGVRDGVQDFRIGGKYLTFSLGATVGPVAFWKQSLSDADIAAWYNSGAGRTYASLVTSYTVQAATGTFALTGQAAALTPRTALYADQGSFTLTGQTVNLKHGYKVAGGTGIFTLGGGDVLFDRTTAITAPVASQQSSASSNMRVIDLSAETRRLLGAHWNEPSPEYEFTGRTFSRRTADSAIYRAQPTAPVEPLHYMMTAQAATFTYVGNDTFGLATAHKSIDADLASFTLSGQAAGLKRGKKLPAVTGAFTLTGQDAALSYFSGNEGEFRTTGSISTSIPNEISVADASIFAINDWVIVEPAEDTERGDIGPGGTWPTLNRRYSSVSAIQTAINAGQIPHGGLAWTSGDSHVYWYVNGELFELVNFYTGMYYECLAVPRALQAKIINIFGNTLVIDPNTGTGGAKITASGLNVYNDRALPLTNAITALSSGQTLTLEAKGYPCGSPVRVDSKSNITIAGQGRDLTRIYAPRGTGAPTMNIYQSPDVTVRDLQLDGNFGDEGFGLNWGGLATSPVSFVGTDDNTMVVNAYYQGIFWDVGSERGIGRRLRDRNVYAGALGNNFCGGLDLDDVIYEQDTPDRHYVGWKVHNNNSSNNRITNFQIRCLNGSMSGLEPFLATDCLFEDGYIQNAIMAFNGGGRCTLNRVDFEFDDQCMAVGGVQYVNKDHPVINVNSFPHPNDDLGANITNVTITQNGYVNAFNDTLLGMHVHEECERAVIRDVTYTASNYSPISGTTTQGARALRATAKGYAAGTTPPNFIGASIQRITVNGTCLNQEPAVSIYVFGGSANLGGHSVPTQANPNVVFYSHP